MTGYIGDQIRTLHNRVGQVDLTIKVCVKTGDMSLVQLLCSPSLAVVRVEHTVRTAKLVMGKHDLAAKDYIHTVKAKFQCGLQK